MGTEGRELSAAPRRHDPTNPNCSYREAWSADSSDRLLHLSSAGPTLDDRSWRRRATSPGGPTSTGCIFHEVAIADPFEAERQYQGLAKAITDVLGTPTYVRKIV